MHDGDVFRCAQKAVGGRRHPRSRIGRGLVGGSMEPIAQHTVDPFQMDRCGLMDALAQAARISRESRFPFSSRCMVILIKRMSV
jgi:hypothetical protein